MRGTELEVECFGAMTGTATLASRDPRVAFRRGEIKSVPGLPARFRRADQKMRQRR